MTDLRKAAEAALREWNIYCERSVIVPHDVDEAMDDLRVAIAAHLAPGLLSDAEVIEAMRHVVGETDLQIWRSTLVSVARAVEAAVLAKQREGT